ncbi:MAG: DNA polymerase Y family protein [Candidatus Lernaella stagnicola]|nr:DNA polymerase Y family protein [Candidatus Lernaella stagnicola]
MRSLVMDRLACVNLPELPLQLLLREHPEWRGLPAAVVAHDRPQGVIRFVSREARARGILPGMSFAQGLSLTVDLRAAVMPAENVREGVTDIARRLRRFSPLVEASGDDPGLFWLDAAGLNPLYRSASQWGRLLAEAVADAGFTATVVIGYRRFAAYAVAKAADEMLVFRSAAEEDEAMRRVPLDRLALSPKLRDTLARLGVQTVGDFVRLPAAGLRRRFGGEAKELHELATDESYAPLRAETPREPVRRLVQFEPPDENAMRLLFVIKRHLHPLLNELARRGRALAELELQFTLEDREPRTDVIRPAEPTLREALIADLIRLRLEGDPLAAPVSDILLLGRDAVADEKQLRMFFDAPKRDLDAGNRALARVRAALGEKAVARARLNAGHLPEACFSWEPLEKLEQPRVDEDAPFTLMRRILQKPVLLPPRGRWEPDGWVLKDAGMGPVVNMWGPYVVSGGWWRREVHRRYYFVETHRGDRLWIYYDASRRRWYWQGIVE